MKSKLMTMLDQALDALPLTGAAIGVSVLACVFSGTLREILQRANMEMLAAAAALLPLSAVLLAFGWSMRDDQAARRQRQRTRREREVERRKAMLRATCDLDDHP